MEHSARLVRLLMPAALASGRPALDGSTSDLGGGEKQSFAILSHLRWIAALAVAYQHIRQGLLVDYAGIPHPSLFAKIIYAFDAYGHAGVVVFFVLSGFLVGGKTLALLKTTNIRADWRQFLLDRASRIFLVLWPALLLTLLVLAALHFLVPAAPFMIAPHWAWDLPAPLAADRAPARWAGAMLLLNGFLTTTPMSDDPLWSLAFEWFYYIFALSFVLACRRVFSAGAIGIILYGAALLLLSLVHNPSIAIAGLIWLFGMIARVTFDHEILRGRIWQAVGLALVFGLLVLERRIPLPDFALGAAVAFMIAHAGWGKFHGGSRVGASLAGFSYSLYVIHFPIMLAVMGIVYATGNLPARLPFDPFGIAIAAATLAAAIIAARLFAMLTEDRTAALRKTLLARLTP
jgi:peptidoglycan/LPS O-acetylase OafA/YrhL